MEVTTQQDSLNWGYIHAQACELAKEHLREAQFADFRAVIGQMIMGQKNANGMLRRQAPALISGRLTPDQMIAMGEIMHGCFLHQVGQPTPPVPHSPRPAPSDKTLSALAGEVDFDTERGQIAAYLLYAASGLRVIAEEQTG